MTSTSQTKTWVAVVAVAMLTVRVLTACISAARDEAPGTAEVTETTPAPTAVWAGLLQRAPYPYTLPLPQPTPSMLDGTYVKVEQSEGEPVHCLRCPDWGVEGGIWKLSLDRGIFRIYHEGTGWHTIGSFVVSRDQSSVEQVDQLLVFNDPVCPSTLGLYTWQLGKGEFALEAVGDPCAIRLRAINLTHLSWHSCQPPNLEAGITDHWEKPAGCD